MLALLDTLDWPTAFLGAIKAGVVPVPVNTLMTEDDYRFMLADSRARALVVSEALLPKFAVLIGACPELMHVIVSGEDARGHRRFEDVLSDADPEFIYRSHHARRHVLLALHVGLDRPSKGGGARARQPASHRRSLCQRRARPQGKRRLLLGGEAVLCLWPRQRPDLSDGDRRDHDFVVRAADSRKRSGDPLPAPGHRVLCRADILCCIAREPAAPKRSDLNLRYCISAGEALPPDIGRRWKERYGVDILDGIGSTEMLHIFLSNYPNDVRYGSTGKPVPGYDIRLMDDDGNVVRNRGEMGELQVRGPTAAAMYWNNREKTRETFVGEWTRSGDKYVEDDDGYYVYCGRRDDMLKVGGIYVSPFEVEGALCTHPDVLEAAVIAWPDQDSLIKPKAFVVLKAADKAGDQLASALQEHVRTVLAPYKYPRWIEFRSELPKTATGKIQRFKLRAESSLRS